MQLFSNEGASGPPLSEVALRNPNIFDFKPGNALDQIGFDPDFQIRALSWNQPFAGLMLHGKQETRRRHTKVRGWVLICSCKVPYTLNTIAKISGGTQYDRMTETLGMGGDGLITGQAIGLGYLHNSRPMEQKDEDITYVKYAPGLFVWEFSDVHRIKPFDWQGKQGWTLLGVNNMKKIEIL